ncbi:MAG: biopolymer transporter ExbD [Planctomycetes bacterium]|nr:biopolymer transporter ExbD [Planctomycetota bacterium]
MKKNLQSIRRHPAVQFNLTPLIDVVFILITFFMLICRSIGRENYKLELPDDCATAVVSEESGQNAITVSVFESATLNEPDPLVLYAIRDQQYDLQSDRFDNDPYQLVQSMSEQLAREVQLKGDSLVYLRADKNMTYHQVQNALLALAQAEIKTVHLAAYRTAQAGDIEGEGNK